MNREELQQILDSGQIATVTFKARTTGEVRVMVCGKIPKEKLKGGKPRYNFTEKNLVAVFDVEKDAIRSVPCDNIISVKAGGKEL